jgi:2-methylcitrate dehydratase PrpD
MPFGAAVSIIYGRASLEEYTEDNLSRPEVKVLMDRVQCVEDPALEENFPSQWPAWVEVDTRDGRNLRADVIYPKGDPENALSWDELKDKFRVLTRPVISSVSQEQIIKTVESLEDLEDIRTLSRMTAI